MHYSAVDRTAWEARIRMPNDSTDSYASCRFLVVDDEEVVRRVVVRVLGKLGCETVSTAASGLDALTQMDAIAAAAEAGPDLILCDLNMPEMDGVEFLRHLATREYRGGIVLISAEDERVLETARNLAKARALNVLGAIPKPVTPATLSKVLAAYSGRVSAEARPQGELISVEEVRAGLEADEFEPFFQPKVGLPDGHVVGAEALVRWRRGDRLIPPGLFISTAEEGGLIDALTDQVFGKAMDVAGAWRRAGFDLKVSVNVSVDSLTDYSLPDRFAERAVQAGVDPTRVMVEVTESRLAQEVAAALETLTRFRLKRIGLSIDDFGTGYSSMVQLKQVPFVELKIDRAFVHDAHRDRHSLAILESSVGLAKRLGLSTVAEGVENQDDWDQVAAVGCDQIQGYFVARPMAADAFLEWLIEWERGLEATPD
ncbi:MAG: hypothetical protein CMM50_17025 [Rhodospirillaceae bacterium]|nr:hypothetical protein [Rhodospirillaceae bacterium]